MRCDVLLIYVRCGVMWHRGRLGVDYQENSVLLRRQHRARQFDRSIDRGEGE